MVVMFVDIAKPDAGPAVGAIDPLPCDLLERCATRLSVIRKTHSGKLVRTAGSTLLCAFEEEAAAVAAACAMQNAIQQNPIDDDIDLALRIAVHAGEATVRNGVCSGEVVTTAARLVSAAEPGQIVVTDTVKAALPAALSGCASRMSGVAAMERRLRLELHEVSWRGNADASAAVAGQGEGAAEVSRAGTVEDADAPSVELASPDPRHDAVAAAASPLPGSGAGARKLQLHLVWQGDIIVVDAENDVVHLGREDPNEIVLETERASRVHAHIEYRDGAYFLVDYSTNGTFVYTQEGEEQKVRDNEVELGYAGAICPGCPQGAVGCEAILFWTETKGD